MKITTKEQFEAAGRELLAANYIANASYDCGEIQRANTRCREIEKAMEAAPFEYSDDEQIIESKMI